MNVDVLSAREFWMQLEHNNCAESDYFQRGASYRNSCTINCETNEKTQYGPVWGTIYCTMRNRNRNVHVRGRSSSASASASHRAIVTGTKRCTSTASIKGLGRESEGFEPSPSRNRNKHKMNERQTVDSTYTFPKRYETTCYFTPLAVPIWYSTTISIKLNSTKRDYKETVHFQNRLVPYRYVEMMSTVTNASPVLFVSDLSIEREAITEHYISLEPQQETALNQLPQPFSTDQQIQIESYA